MANNLNIEQGSGPLTISYSWKTPSMWGLAFFSIIWNLPIIFAITTVTEIDSALFVGFFQLIGVFLAWYTITRFTNHTKITVDQKKMTIHNGPVPWPFVKDIRIPAQAFVQLYLSDTSIEINGQPAYNLMAKLDTDVEIPLIKLETDKPLLSELEWTIEAYLDIKNDTSFDFSANGDPEKLDLEQMKAQLKQMKSLEKWLPSSLGKQKELLEEKIHQREISAPFSSASSLQRDEGSANSEISPKDDDFVDH